jgi:hypothetical protein
MNPCRVVLATREYFRTCLKSPLIGADTQAMKAQQFIEQATAEALALHTRHREAYEDTFDYLARPGRTVIVIKKPWPIGRSGKVFEFSEPTDGYFRVGVEMDGKRVYIPAYALARWLGAPDCEKAELRHFYFLMKLNAGGFPEFPDDSEIFEN